MSEFRINEHLSLRLEEGKTIIYVNNERFSQCKFLLLNIHIDEITSFDKIQSIDEASEKLDNTLETDQVDSEKIFDIPSEVEFWGHCSNLQVWAENRYDTRLLHRNLAFPLLKKLTEVGDPYAKSIFKEEIVKRLSSGERTVHQFLMNEGYINILEEIELETYFYSMPYLFKEFFAKLEDEKDEEIREEYEYDLSNLLTILNKTDHLLDKLVLNNEMDLLRNLIKIMYLTLVDEETIDIILDMIKKLMISSKEIQEVVKKEISYQFNYGTHEILLGLMYDKFFRILDNSSIKTLFTNENFIDNFLILIENDPDYLKDSLIEFIKRVNDDIDEKLIQSFKKLANNDMARFIEKIIK